MFMQWFLENWRAFADWAAAQPVLVQITIGSLLLMLAYAAFVCTLTKLTGRRPVLPRQPSDTIG